MNLSLREKAQAYQHWKVATCTAGAALIESVLASALAGVATADLSQVDLGQSFGSISAVAERLRGTTSASRRGGARKLAWVAVAPRPKRHFLQLPKQ